MTTFANAKEAIDLIEDVQQKLDRALDLIRPIAAQDTEPDVGGLILAEVLEQGGSVTKDELYQIAASRGMDRRGLGGFFRQSGKTSLYVVPGDRVLLTPYGVERAQRYASRQKSYEYEPSDRAYSKVAEPTFAEDWDSDEDSVYDGA